MQQSFLVDDQVDALHRLPRPGGVQAAFGHLDKAAYQLLQGAQFADVAIVAGHQPARPICRTLEGLRSAHGYIRRELARSINLRNTPDVRFILDQSIEYGVSMSKKIDEINAAMHEREREASEE